MILPSVFKSTLTSRAALYNVAGRRSTNRGNRSGKAGVNSRGVLYIKDADEDMDALTPTWDSGSPGPSVEMHTPTYNVSVTGGGPKKGGLSDLGGIQTTTVVTQRVDSL